MRLVADPGRRRPRADRWTATPTSSGSPGSIVDTGAHEGSASRGRERVAVRRGHRQRTRRPGRWPPRCIPTVSAALDAAQDRAAAEIVGWVAQHATTRVGPRGRQVQVPVEQIEAAVIRHYTSRAGDPHRHLHLQINARVFAAGAWRGLHSVGCARHDRGDQRHRARRRRHRPGVPGGPRRTRLHPGRRDRGDRAARAVRRGVQRPDRSDPPQHRPVRSRVAARASRRGTGAAAARGVGSAGVGRCPAGQGRPDGRRGAGRAVERRAARPGLPRPGRPSRARGDPGRAGSTATGPRTGSISQLGAKRSAWNAADIRGQGRGPAGPDQPGRRARGADRARRGRHRPRRRTLCPAAHLARRARTRPLADLASRCSTVEADLVRRLARRAEHARQAGPAATGAGWRGSTRPRPPSSAPWPATARWWSWRARPVQARPPR